jgi:translocation and assembly module TamB
MELVGRRPSGVLLDSLTLRAGGLAWRLENPATVRWGDVEGVQVANLFLRSTTDSAAIIRVNGAVPPDGTNDLQVEVRRLDLELVRRLVPTSPDVAGVVDLDLVLQGSTTDPELVVQGYGTGLRFEGVALDSLSLNAQYDERRLVSRANLWQGSLRVAAAEAEVPMTLSVGGGIPAFELLRSAPLLARLQADSLPIALLTAATTEVTEGAGTIVGELNLAGTMENPTLSGFATVRDGAITAPELGRRFERISGHFILDEQQVLIDSLVVWSDGRGEVNGSVRVTDLERPELYLSADFDGFHAIDNDQIADLTMSGSVRLEGVMPQPVLSGAVRLQGGAIYIPSMNEQVPLEITDVEVGQVGADTAVAAVVGPSVLEQMRINNLEVVVDEGVWLESDEAHVQIQGELVVIRNGPAMQLYGTLQAMRGTYNLAIGPIVRDFEVVSGSVRFLGTPDFNPEIDITAEHEVRAGTTAGSSLAVVVHLTGTLENPSIQLTSNTRPPLPESELLSWLVFGQPSFRLNQSAAGLTNQLLVQEFVGGLLTQELGNLGLPCEYFRLRGRPNILGSTSDPLGATSVECGVQLLEDVFLTVETGMLSSLTGGGSSFLGALLGVSLDWQVNDKVTATLAREPVQSSYGTMLLAPGDLHYQWSADVRGTWEFGHPAEPDIPAPDVENLPIESEPPMQPATPAAPAPAAPPPKTEEEG